MGTGFRTATSGGVAAPPYTNGPYTFSEDMTFAGDVTVEGDFTFGNAATDNLTVNGDLIIIDNKFLHLGTDEDVSITYDETTDDVLKITGAAWQWGVDDTGIDVKMFGATAGAYLLWDESADSLLLVGGAKLNCQGTVTVGVDDTGYDVKFFGATASAYLLWDESADALLLGGDSRLDLSSATIAAANTDGGVIKCGTSGARVVEDTANMKFMSFYFDNGATSGDNRGMYLRQYLTGAGGGGEALRVFTDCEDVACGTAHGAHISIKFGTTGSITGLGVGSRNTIHVPNALSGGTYAASQSEIYHDGASSDVSGATNFSFHRFVNDGNASGKATVDTAGYLFSVTGLTAASGKLFQANTAAAATHALRIDIGGTDYFIMLTDTGA